MFAHRYNFLLKIATFSKAIGLPCQEQRERQPNGFEGLKLHAIQNIREEAGLVDIVHLIGLLFIVAALEDVLVVRDVLQVDKELLRQAALPAVELKTELHVQAEVGSLRSLKVSWSSARREASRSTGV